MPSMEHSGAHSISMPFMSRRGSSSSVSTRTNENVQPPVPQPPTPKALHIHIVHCGRDNLSLACPRCVGAHGAHGALRAGAFKQEMHPTTTTTTSTTTSLVRFNEFYMYTQPYKYTLYASRIWVRGDGGSGWVASIEWHTHAHAHNLHSCVRGCVCVTR